MTRLPRAAQAASHQIHDRAVRLLGWPSSLSRDLDGPEFVSFRPLGRPVSDRFKTPTMPGEGGSEEMEQSATEILSI
jgi:hypothetical protein